MTNDIVRLISACANNGTVAIYIENGNKMPISCAGSAILKTSQAKINLNNVFIVLNLK